MDSSWTVAELFEVCIRAEGEALEFYKALARLFRHQPDVAGFFEEMVQEEAGHAGCLKSILDSLDRKVAEGPVPSHAIVMGREFLKFNAKESLKAVKSLDDAYKLAVNLEFSEVNKFYELLVELYDKDDARRAQMLGIIKGHMDKVRGFPHRFGDTMIRASILPRP